MITQAELRSIEQSENTFIQALLFETVFDEGTVITYVLQGNPGDTDPYGGALWATDDRAEAFALALAAWSNVADISFVQSDVGYDGTGSTAAFDWVETLEELEEGVLGQHSLPAPGLMGGIFNIASGFYDGDAVMPGGLGFATLVHEIGHGIGLLHPHTEGGGFGWDFAFPGVSDPFDTGTFGLNQGPFTVMTYNSGYAEVGLPLSASIGWEQGPGAFDIAAVQYIYGANLTYNTGNDTYSLVNENVPGTGWSSIWDAGGTDTLSASGTILDAYLDLRAATLELEPGGGGWVSRVDGILGGYTIANNVVIENATGGAGDDVLIGNEADNTLNGGSGFDIVSYAHLSTGVVVDLNAHTATGDGSDTLLLIEGVRGGAGDDTLTASNQTDIGRDVDLEILGGDSFLLDAIFGGDAFDNAIALDDLFAMSIFQQPNANTNSVLDALVTVDAVGRGHMDYYSFSLSPTQQASEIIVDIDSTFNLDSIVTLYDSDGNLLATNDDIGAQVDAGSASFTDSYLTFQVPAGPSAPQSFVVEVSSYSPGGPATISSQSSYTLHIAGNVAVFGQPDLIHSLLDGGAGNDILIGGDGNDHLIGGEGEDTFYYSAGVDRLEGGEGSDTYYILGGNGQDVSILEHNHFGTDLVISSVSYTLEEGIENLQLAADAGQASATGNSSDNTITGNAAGNSIAAMAGDDVIYAGGGNDIVNGGDGNDRLYGQAGVDILEGGAGNDHFYLSSQDDTAIEDSDNGFDTVYIDGSIYMGANLEALIIAGTSDYFGVGNELDNEIEGNVGDNLLIAGLGDDLVLGLDGDDSVFGEDGDDVLVGNGGVDYLIGGLGNDTLIGVEGADALYGQDGDDILASDAQVLWYNPYAGASVRPRPDPEFVTDILVGGAGNDTIYGNSGLGDYDLLYGNTGNDTFYVDTPDDLVFEQAGEGNDTVYADISGAGYYLYDNIENLILEGATPFGVGNALDNTLIGSSADNWLLGGAGNDTLNAMAGNDVLFGEAGNDTFIFGIGTGGDVVGDFTQGDDLIDLQDFGLADFAALQSLFIQNGDVGAINLGGIDFVVLHNVQMDQLVESDFLI